MMFEAELLTGPAPGRLVWEYHYTRPRWPHGQWAFRIIDGYGQEDMGGRAYPRVAVRVFEIARATPAGYVVRDMVTREERFVACHWMKKHAHLSLDEALAAWRMRKARQLGLLRAYLEHVKACNELEIKLPEGFHAEATR